MVAAPQPAAPLRTYSPAFFQALAALSAHGVTPAHAGAALGLWWQLAAHGAREPIVQVAPGGPVGFAWNRDRYLLTVDVHPDGRFKWYFRDRAEDRSEGTEDAPEAALLPAFWDCLRLAGV